jgi:hypothetical protein
MHLHSDVLRLSDVRQALRDTGLSARGVYLDWERDAVERGSRKRARRIDFWLTADDGHGRRFANSGTRGALEWRAPLYDEWGALLGELFSRDPRAVTDYYDGADDFLRMAKAHRHKSAPGGDVKRECPTSLDEWRNLYRREPAAIAS